MAISVNGHQLEPTIFPDGTSQVWHLPQEIIETDKLNVDWRFESEREIIDLFSLRALNSTARLYLFVPYFPYARQDKPISNDSTFNLVVFWKLLRTLNAEAVTAIDLHNESFRPPGLVNLPVTHIQRRLIEEIGAEVIVYPDEGALKRYGKHFSDPKLMTFEKERDQATGKILGHRICHYSMGAREAKRFLILDDICDGGATFLSVANAIRKECGQGVEISLFVTHGIFSRGRAVLEDAGIKLFTTDSLPRNKGKEGVFEL